MTNREATQLFGAGKKAASNHFQSTGREAFSYNMKIAQYLPNGKVEVISRKHSPSKTTSRHISLVCSACAPCYVEVDEFTDVSPFSYGDK